MTEGDLSTNSGNQQNSRGRGVLIDGALLARERKKLGFSQAKFCTEFRLSRKIIKDVEAHPGQRRVQPQTLADIAAALGIAPHSLTAEYAPPRLLTDPIDLAATSRHIARSAEEIICATGSRSRDEAYLHAIEDTIAKKSEVAYFRILFDTPASPEMLAHLRRMLVLRNARGVERRNVSISIFGNAMTYPAELALCLNEGAALFVLPSVHGAWRYDTAVVFEDPKPVEGWRCWIEEMYRMGSPIRTAGELAKYGKAHH